MFQRKCTLFGFYVIILVTMDLMVVKNIHGAEPVSILLQKGIYEEETVGDLDSAIEIYKRIVSETEANRSYVAQAQYRIGVCYQKKGKIEESKKAYQKLIDQFPSEIDIIAQAKKRMASLGDVVDKSQSGSITQELKIDLDNAYMNLNGDKIVYRKWTNTMNLFIYDLSTGEETQLTHHEKTQVSSPILSPDGDRIAYCNVDNPSNKLLFHILNLQTGEDIEFDYNGIPMDWSVDGNNILIIEYGGQADVEKTTYCMVSTKENRFEKTSLKIPKGTWELRFSPDSEYISFLKDNKLFLYHIRSEEMFPLIPEEIGYRQHLWSPDGKRIVLLFNQGFGPEKDLCALPVTKGKQNGEVRIVSPDFGDNINLLSMSQAGKMFYKESYDDCYIYLKNFDSETGQTIGEAKKLTVGSQPMFSSDGKRISYILDGSLHVMASEGGNDQQIAAVKFHATGTYSWGPDNDTIYLPEGGNINAITLSTKEKTSILKNREICPTRSSHIACSPDGKKISYVKEDQSAESRGQLCIVDIDGENFQQLTSYDYGNVYYPTWSPDSNEIAFEHGPGYEIKSVLAISLINGATRELFRGKTTEDRFFQKSWSSDGKWMLFGTRIGNIETGEIKSLDYGINGIDGVYSSSFSPDGSKILLGTYAEITKYMIMESFLPETDKEE